VTTTITCPECRTSLRLADELAPGKLIRCPKCAEVLRVPGKDPGLRGGAPRPSPLAAGQSRRRPSRPATVHDEVEEEEEVRPDRRRSAEPEAEQTSVVWIVLGVFALVALAGVGFLLVAMRLAENR
jgi:predicted Zn finger-like uncharacterized protein